MEQSLAFSCFLDCIIAKSGSQFSKVGIDGCPDYGTIEEKGKDDPV